MGEYVCCSLFRWDHLDPQVNFPLLIGGSPGTTGLVFPVASPDSAVHVGGSPGTTGLVFPRCYPLFTHAYLHAGRPTVSPQRSLSLLPSQIPDWTFHDMTTIIFITNEK